MEAADTSLPYFNTPFGAFFILRHYWVAKAEHASALFVHKIPDLGILSLPLPPRLPPSPLRGFRLLDDTP